MASYEILPLSDGRRSMRWTGHKDEFYADLIATEREKRPVEELKKVVSLYEFPDQPDVVKIYTDDPALIERAEATWIYGKWPAPDRPRWGFKHV